MFAKPKTRDSIVDKIKVQGGNSPQRQTYRKINMANSVKYTDYTGGYPGNGVEGGFDSPNMYQMCQSLNMNSQEKRIEKLEERLSIIASQYDQFIPLLGLLEQANNINKFDGTIKKVQKKQTENDEKIAAFQQQLLSMQRNVDVIKMQYLNGISNQEPPSVVKQNSQLLKREKSQNSSNSESELQLSQLIKNQSKIENNFSSNIKELRDEINQKLTSHNRSLEDFRQVFSNEQQGIHQTLAHISNNYSTMLNSGRSKGDEFQAFGEISKMAEDRFNQQTLILREQIEKEFQNIWREIGVITVFQQLGQDSKRKEKVSNILVLPDNLDKFERLLKINNVEQGVLLDEMDQFNKDNCQRLINELRSLDERVHIKQERLQLFRNRVDEVEIENTKKEIEMILEHFHHLKNQIDGTRKISVCELKRIEDKMEQIDNIRVRVSNDPNEKKDLQRITLDIKKAISFQEKISKLIEHIDENLNIVNDFQLKVDHKLAQLQQDLYSS